MNRRRGISLIELIAAAALLTVLLLVLAHVLALVSVQRRASDRRMLAVEEVANVMEQIAVREYEELLVDQPFEIPLSDAAQKSLPDAQLTIEISPTEMQPPTGKRITVELVWQNRAGQTNGPVRLTAWRYR